MARGILKADENRMIRALCAVYAGRLLGLYMVLPVLSLHTRSLQGSTSLLIGLSLGIYGATQAILQIPFGYLSDRIGRRRTLTVGLVLFTLGSFLAAFARDARLLVLARAIQGSGAISSVVLALIVDLTREEVRTQAMANVGIWIGSTFAIALIVGPPLASLVGVPALFLATGIGAGLSLVYLFLAVHDPPSPPAGQRLHAVDLLTVLRQPPLLLVDVGVFLLHAVVTVLFVVLPFDLAAIVGPKNTWIVLVPVISIGVALMAAVGRWADRYRLTERLFFIGAAVLALSCAGFALVGKTPAATLVGLFLFVISIAVLEPTLASLLSRFAEGPHRGTATGVYSMAQYSGAFVGGVLGGAFLFTAQGALFFALFLAIVAWGLLTTRVSLRRLGPGRRNEEGA